jgi:hypothetical protein
MKRKRGLILIGVLILSSVSCWLVEAANPVAQHLNPTKSIEIDLAPLDKDHPCRGTFDVLDDYKIDCLGNEPSIQNTFTGLVQYTGTNYVGTTKLLVNFRPPLEEPYQEAQCVIELTHVAPNETRPITCQVTGKFCADYIIGYLVDICEYETYTDYLDAQDLPEEIDDGDDAEEDKEQAEETGEPSEIDVEDLLSLSGEWVSDCDSPLPYYNCMKDDENCEEDYEENIMIDFAGQTFIYHVIWSYYEDLATFEFEGTYEDCTGGRYAKGKVFEDGWMIGVMETDSYCVYMSWMFGNFEEGERESSDYSLFIGKISLEPNPIITYTFYSPVDEISPDMEFDHVPESYKRLIDEYCTVCELIKDE